MRDRKKLENILKKAFIELGYKRGLEEKVRDVLYKVAGEITFEKYIKGKKFVNPKTKNKVNFGSLPKDYQEHLREAFNKKIKEIKENKKKTVVTEIKELPDVKEEAKKVEAEIKKQEEKFKKDPEHRAEVVGGVVERIESPEVKNELVEGIKRFVNAEDFKKFGDSLKELDVEGMKKSLPGVAKGTLKGVLGVVGGMLVLGGMGAVAKDMVMGSVEDSMEEIEARRREELAWEHFEEMEGAIEEVLDDMEFKDEDMEEFKDKFGAEKIVKFSTMDKIEEGDLNRPAKYLRVVVEVIPESELEGKAKDYEDTIGIVPDELKVKMYETEKDFKTFYREEVLPELEKDGEIKKELQVALMEHINERVEVSQQIISSAKEVHLDEYGESEELKKRFDEYDQKMEKLSKYDPMEQMKDDLEEIYDEEINNKVKKETMKNILDKYEAQLNKFNDLRENNPDDYDALPEEVKQKAEKLEQSYKDHKRSLESIESRELGSSAEELKEMKDEIKTMRKEVGTYQDVKDKFYDESKKILKKGSMKKYSKEDEMNMKMLSEMVLDKLKMNIGYLK